MVMTLLSLTEQAVTPYLIAASEAYNLLLTVYSGLRTPQLR